MFVADAADPVPSILRVLPARLAHAHPTGAAGGASVDDPAQLGPAARARAAALQTDAQSALAAQVLKLSFQPAEIESGVSEFVGAGEPRRKHDMDYSTTCRTEAPVRPDSKNGCDTPYLAERRHWWR